MKCVLCNLEAISTAAQIPVCEEHLKQYQTEGERYLPESERHFYQQLKTANAGRKDPKTCKHEEFFAKVDVHRLTDTGRFQADIRISCEQCGTPFRFLGLPAGLDMNGAAVSVDGTEGRFAIGTAETVANIIDGVCPVGFTVRRS